MEKTKTLRAEPIEFKSPKLLSQVSPWLIFSMITTLTWGIWGGVMEFPAKWGFPETLGYITWSLTMLPCSLVALHLSGWKLNLDRRSIFLGSVVGFLGAGGQLLLFLALRQGPAYIIFPIISLYPVLTIALSLTILRERARTTAWVGIALALLAVLFLSYQPPTETQVTSYIWLILAALVFVMWGLQAFVMKFSTDTMSSESLFFYMMATAILLAPVAYFMTDLSLPINWGVKGLYASTFIQSLNAIGALFLVYALRYGKAIVVVPMTSLAPVITIGISLALYSVIPPMIVIVGMVLAIIAIYLLALE